MEKKVNVFSEFQELKSVILGSPFLNDFTWIKDESLRVLVQRIHQETLEDLEQIENVLVSMGIEVFRPNHLDIHPLQRIQAPFLNSEIVRPPIAVRDLTLIIGNSIIETYGTYDSRFFESLFIKKILFDHYKDGHSRWIAMPQPLNSFQENYDFFFESANIIKCGEDIFLNETPHKNYDAGVRGANWIKKELSDFKINTMSQPHLKGHIDGKISLLKPGLALTSLQKKDLPKKLQKWDTLQIKKFGIPEKVQNYREKNLKGFCEIYLNDWMGSPEQTYFDLNVLSLSEESFLCINEDIELFRKIKKFGIEPIVVPFRHKGFWDSGLHCLTLDLYRSGGKENYF